MRYVIAILLVLPLLLGDAEGQHCGECGNGYTSGIIAPNPKINILFEPDPDYCSKLSNKGYDYDASDQFQKEYDTLKAYVEQCPLDKNAFRAFGGTSNAANGLEQQGDTIWAAYRDWLRKVLYYNPDSTYYCSDLIEYAGTFEFRDEIGNDMNFKTTLSILRYLGDSSNCFFLKDYSKFVWNTYHHYWQDTVKDSSKTPLDSNLYTIDEINHSWLRGLARGVNYEELNISRNGIGELSAVKNPFTDELELHYTVTKPAVAKLEIYDALGRMLWSDGQGYLEPREHILKINSSQWSSGSYYARIVTLQGEVKTCKLVKE